MAIKIQYKVLNLTHGGETTYPTLKEVQDATGVSRWMLRRAVAGYYRYGTFVRNEETNISYQITEVATETPPVIRVIPDWDNALETTQEYESYYKAIEVHGFPRSSFYNVLNDTKIGELSTKPLRDNYMRPWVIQPLRPLQDPFFIPTEKEQSEHKE